MKIRSSAVLTGLLLTGCLPVHADVKARITYDKNVIVDIVNPVLQNNELVLPQGFLPVARIQQINFEFDNGLTLEKCTELFKTAKFSQLETLLTSGLSRISSFETLPGNLDDYLVWKMKVLFWNGQYEAMRKTADLLRQRTPASFGLTGMYNALALMDQDQTENAGLVFAAVENPESVSAPMTFFIRARLAMAKRNYKEALQELARIVVAYDRDMEWMPAATLYEGMIYKRTGYLEASGNVAEELSFTYPDGYWSRLGAELKESKTE